MKRIVMFALALMLPIAAFAQGKTVELDLWHRWSGTNEAGLTAVIQAFEAKNPDVRIKTTAKPGEYMELLQKMIADLAAGNPPPELFVGGYNLMNYIYTEMKPTLIDALAPNAAAYAAFSGKYIPAMLKLGQVNGDQIGVPFALSNIVLYYNKDVFAAAGLTDKDVPRTWDELLRVGKLIKQKTGKYAVGMQKVDSWPDLGIIYSNGGKLLSNDGTRVAFNNKEAAEAITMWQSLHLQGLAPINTDAELQANFISGGVAMYVSSCMKLSSIRSSAKFNLKVAECPAFGSKPKALPAGGAAIMCFNREKNKREGIWGFMDFATSQEAMALFTKTGYLAVTKVKVPIAEGQEAAYNQLKYAVPWTSWPGGSAGLEIDRLYINKRMELIHGNGDVAKVLDQLASDCNKLLQ